MDVNCKLDWYTKAYKRKKVILVHVKVFHGFRFSYVKICYFFLNYLYKFKVFTTVSRFGLLVRQTHIVKGFGLVSNRDDISVIFRFFSTQTIDQSADESIMDFLIDQQAVITREQHLLNP